jgi:NAD(P)-dependent dehydrogenase (short-subunit alcohol dehydrogenase family)
LWSPAAVTWELVDPCAANERFVDQVVLVTGAAGMIGAGLVKGFLSAGASVHAVDIDGPGLDRLRVDAGAEVGDRLTIHTADLGDPDAVAHLASGIDQLEVLVNNVGWNDFVLGAEAPTAESWRRILDVNLIGPALLTGQLVPRLAASGNGAVVFITSINGLHPSPWLPYGAAKAAVAKVVVDLAHQLAARHVRVNAVAPGSVRSAGLDADPGTTGSGVVGVGAVPIEAIVNAVLFLSDSRTSPMTTGQHVLIDGASKRSRDRLFDPVETPPR